MPTKYDSEISNDQPLGKCGFCGGPVCHSTLKDGDYCQKCKLDYKSSTMINGFYMLSNPYDEHSLKCPFCLCNVGKYYAKQKPPEMIAVQGSNLPNVPAFMVEGDIDHADPQVQKQLIYLWKEHRPACVVGW